MKIYLAADHGGYELKNSIAQHLQAKGIEVQDFGPHQLVPDDDYPDYVIPAMEQVQQAKTAAIITCRNGVGVSVLANKFKDIRCALCYMPEQAKTSREDDNSNVLALPADFITNETALKTVDAWLETPFSNEERHIRRLKKISQVEK